jgi:hypothetical protein
MLAGAAHVGATFTSRNTNDGEADGGPAPAALHRLAARRALDRWVPRRTARINQNLALLQAAS